MDALYLEEVAELLTYWSDNPPAHVLLGAVLRGIGGVGGVGEKPFVQSSEEEVRGLIDHIKTR